MTRRKSGSKKENTYEVKQGKICSGNSEPIKPLNDKQKQYMSAIRNSPTVICTGVWGSSKTFIPSCMAADMLRDEKVEKIIVARPAEGKGKSLGFFKGDKNEKLEGWVAPVADTLKKRLGDSNYKYHLEHGNIELLALEQVKGRSWDNCFIIVDEAEDLDPEVAKSLVGRQGINSKTVITGDIRQQDIKKNSGLQLLLDVKEYAELDVPHIDFDSWEYCVRSPEAKEWGKAFENYSKGN